MRKLAMIAVSSILILIAGCTSSGAASGIAEDKVAAAGSAPAAALQTVSPEAFAGAQFSAAERSADSAQPADLAQAAVDLDWSRYCLKDVSPKTVNGKSYSAFEIWDEDYCVGPMLLVNSDDGQVYTWTALDSGLTIASEDQAFDKTPRTVTGVMEDSAMMSVVILTDTGDRLTVRRLGVDTTGLKSMVIGDRIKVTYTGVISGSNTMRAFIVKLENVK